MTSNAKLAEVTARIAPRSRDGLTPALTVLQDRGYKLAPAPDGGTPGASGRLPAVIPVSPDALSGGPLSRLADGDIIRLAAERGTLDVELSACGPRALRPQSRACGDARIRRARAVHRRWSMT